MTLLASKPLKLCCLHWIDRLPSMELQTTKPNSLRNHWFAFDALQCLQRSGLWLIPYFLRSFRCGVDSARLNLCLLLSAYSKGMYKGDSSEIQCAAQLTGRSFAFWIDRPITTVRSCPQGRSVYVWLRNLLVGCFINPFVNLSGESAL